MPAEKRNVATEPAALPAELAALVRANVGTTTPTRLAAGRERLLARGPRRPSRRAWLWLAPAFAAAAAVALAVRPHAPVLSYEIRDGVVTSGELVASKAPAHVRFSDASHLALAPGSAARVEEVGAHGARLRLRTGRADLEITPRAHARWTVAAGPFRIHVLGTRFSVAWSDATEQLDVRLDRGEVEITGPLLDRPVGLHPGQRLVASVPAGEVRVTSADAVAVTPVPAEEPVAQPRPAPVAAPVRERRPVRKAVPAAKPAAAPPTRSWSERLRAGAFGEIVGQAERQDLGALCATAPLEDLAALADAARYERRPALAAQTLEALRARFPRAVASRDAAFHLGRLEEGAHGATPDALRWYERYAAESPRGVYAAEALARRIGVVKALRGAEAARPLAEDYLRRFPNGAFAEGARGLLAASVAR